MANDTQNEKDELLSLVLVRNWTMVDRLYDEKDAFVKEVVARLLVSLGEVEKAEGVDHSVEKPASGREALLRASYRTGEIALGFINVGVGVIGEADFMVQINAKLPRSNIGTLDRTACREHVRKRIQTLILEAANTSGNTRWSIQDSLNGEQNTDLVGCLIKPEVVEGGFTREAFLSEVVELCTDRVSVYAEIFEWWRDILRAPPTLEEK